MSLDFELHWGMRDKATVDEWGDRLLGAREAIPRLLDLMKRYQISSTWATVGMLFAKSRKELMSYIPDGQPHYEREELSPYNQYIGADEENDPFHYAPSLIEKICRCDSQELATHTFSHYYCLEKGQNAKVFREDVKSAMEIAAGKGIELQSIVFPRNQYNPEYEEVLVNMGLRAYRGTIGKWPYRAGRSDEVNAFSRRLGRLVDTYLPVFGRRCFSRNDVLQSENDGLYNIPASLFFRSYSEERSSFETLRVQRIVQEIEHAAKTGKIFHLWSHPHNFGIHSRENLALLEIVFQAVDKCRRSYGMKSVSMSGLIECI